MFAVFPLTLVGGIGIVRYRKFYALIYINNSQAINHLMQTFMAEIQNRLCWNWLFLVSSSFG